VNYVTFDSNFPRAEIIFSHKALSGFTHELKMEETDPTEIENLTAKSSTNKTTFKRTIVKNNFSINEVHRWKYVSRMYGGRASDKFITSDSEDLL
jgi:hypothetical protein